MPRPVRTRQIHFQPGVTYFKPAGVPMYSLDEVIIKYEEAEAIRLNDFECFGQIKSSKKMGVSQPTFFRVLSSARKKIADAITNGKAIKVEGGEYKFKKKIN